VTGQLKLRSGFLMACCCSPHESNATCDVIHSQGSRLPMELRCWSIPCSFHVSQVKTAPVLTSYKSPLIPHVFEYSSFLTILVSVPHLEANKKNLIPNYSKTLLLHSIFSMSYGGDDSSYGVRRCHAFLWINGVTDKCSKSSGRQQGGGYGGGGDSYGVST
jgi:hypothetical protein